MFLNSRQIRTLAGWLIVFSIGSSITFLLMHQKSKNEPSKYFGPQQANPDADRCFLLVLILTAPANIDRRNTIRQTWLPLRAKIDATLHEVLAKNIDVPTYNDEGFVAPQSVTTQKAMRELQPPIVKPLHRINYQSLSVEYRFVVGSLGTSRTQLNQMQYEAAQEKDMIFLPQLQDSYRNLTQKLLMSIAAVSADLHFEYLLKCDDDTYARVDRIAAELYAYNEVLGRQSYAPNPRPELYWGYFNGRANVKRGGKWQESNFKMCDLYPPYALGGGYVISGGLAQYIRANWMYLSAFVSEDVSMGVWLGALRHVYRRHDVRFDAGYLPRSCKAYHLLVHKRSAVEMKRLRGGDLCSFEENDLHGQRRPLEYFYDWEAAPSKCCVPSVH